MSPKKALPSTYSKMHPTAAMAVKADASRYKPEKRLESVGRRMSIIRLMIVRTRVLRGEFVP
jgi:hypothetical protein